MSTWPVLTAADALDQHVEIGIEPNRNTLGRNALAGDRIHKGATAGRQHLRTALQQTRNDTRFAGAKIRLPVQGKNIRNRHPGRLFDFGIGIHKRDPDALRKPAPDR